MIFLIVITDYKLSTVRDFSEYLQSLWVSYVYEPLTDGILRWIIETDDLYLEEFPPYMKEIYITDSDKWYKEAEKSCVPSSLSLTTGFQQLVDLSNI